MRTFLSIAIAWCVAYSWPLLGAEEKTKCFSPDGKFALHIGDQNNSGDAKTEIIELGTQKPVLELGVLGHPNEEDSKLVWSPDSQKVAFFEPTKRGGLTHVYFRNGTLFEEIQLPTLPEPKTPKKVPADVYDKAITALNEPVRWLKSGALVIYSEVEGDYSGRGALEITIGFNENHKPSVVQSRKISPRTVVASSAVAAGNAPEEVIRALYKAHRPWEHKELNLGNRAALSKYFSPELTKLFLKNAQLERDCPKGDLCGLEFDPILGSQDFDDHLDFKLHITEATPPQTGRFEARFKLFNEGNPEQEQVLVFQLIQVKNGWRIDDITYTKDNTSLKPVITAILDEAAHLKE